jgi:hypothetical protein
LPEITKDACKRPRFVHGQKSMGYAAPVNGGQGCEIEIPGALAEFQSVLCVVALFEAFPYGGVAYEVAL